MATKRAPRPVRTPEKRAAFLASIAKGGSVSEAARKASIARSAAYAWKAEDPAFSSAWDSATEESVDALEAQARKRAMKNSDLLLIFLLRHRRPAIFRPPSRVALGGDPEAPPIATNVAVQIFLPDNARDANPPAPSPGDATRP
jgi:transposase-like protein